MPVPANRCNRKHNQIKRVWGLPSILVILGLISVGCNPTPVGLVSVPALARHGRLTLP
jgi:hypothetical protein